MEIQGAFFRLIFDIVAGVKKILKKWLELQIALYRSTIETGFMCVWSGEGENRHMYSLKLLLLIMNIITGSIDDKV